MSTRAKYSGAVGTVIDGRFRDLDEHRDLEFPVSLSMVGHHGSYIVTPWHCCGRTGD
jgi:regulator of RNase E activity RraA